MLLVAEVPPGHIIPGWERYEIAIVANIPSVDHVGTDTLILVDPEAIEQ